METPLNFNQNNDTNLSIEDAYNLSINNYTHAELSDMLLNGNIKEKQIAALKFDKIDNINDAQLLLENLTGCDGKIREAVAYKINLFITQNPDTRRCFAETSPHIFAKATIDINGNICRLIVDSAAYLKEFEAFSEKYTEQILKYTQEALDELDKFIFKDKKYIINKQLFKLYWCLDALNHFQDCADYNVLYDILQKCIKQQEYTIREKCAQIIASTDIFQTLREQLINDENYYVRNVFKSSTHLSKYQDDHPSEIL